MLTNVEPTQAETSGRRGPRGVSCIVACLFLVACRKAEQQSAAGQTAPRATDAGVAPTDAALRRADAADWVEPARWRFDTIADLYQRDCPNSIPVSATTEKANDYRTDGTNLKSCARNLGGVHGKTRKYVGVSLGREVDGPVWTTCRGAGECWLANIRIDYERADGRIATECAHIGVDIAEYGKAVIGLTEQEASRLAATVQGSVNRDINSKAHHWLRVPVHDQRLILTGSQELWPDGQSTCLAIIHSGTVLRESEVVDVPLAELPAVTGGDGT